jgi:hypothetical protein
VDRLVQRLDAKVCLQRVGDPFTASSATRALNATSWFLRFDMF